MVQPRTVAYAGVADLPGWSGAGPQERQESWLVVGSPILCCCSRSSIDGAVPSRYRGLTLVIMPVPVCTL